MHLVVAGSFTCYWDHDWAYFFLLMIGKYLFGFRGFLLYILIRFFISYNNISTALILLYFCNKKIHMLDVNVAVYCGCLLVWLACSAWFKGLCINSCFLFLVGLFVCFSCFFFAHFDNSNFNRGLLQNSRPSFLPVEGSVLFFPCAFSFA